MKLRTILLETLLAEGVYDPSIFKAIFIVGGPGSGKSFTTAKSTRGFGFKVVSSDDPLMLLMRKRGLDFKMPDSEAPVRNAVRAKAKVMSDRSLESHVDGRLGIILDETGSDFERINKEKAYLESLGYDTFMIFVNTSLEIAQERNKLRDRSVPPDLVTDKWKSVQQNMGKFQGLFGAANMIIIDNDNPEERRFDALWKEVMKFANRPVKNRKATAWIAQQLDAKNRTSNATK